MREGKKEGGKESKSEKAKAENTLDKSVVMDYNNMSK